VIHVPENGLKGRDFRPALVGIDYEDVLRDAVKTHIEFNSRTVEDVALSLRTDPRWLQRWLNGEEEATLQMLSTLCANVNMSASDVFSYSREYSDAQDVSSFKDLLIKRLSAGISQDRLMLLIAVQNLIASVPSSAVAIRQGVVLATKVGKLSGYDVTAVVRGLERLRKGRDDVKESAED
jgi:hypothetical protein